MKRGGVHSNTKVVDLEQPASTICTNKDGSRVAVAGRRIFKLLDVDQDYRVIIDFRDLPQKQLNLNYSSNHVQWNPRDESQLASAPTNSSVVIWDINKTTKSKLTYVFEQVHSRAVNKLSYHPKDSNILLSGSQDFHMICFDTRQRSIVNKYVGPDSVRDVQYSPHSEHYFAAAYESGDCQIWDRRHPDNAMKQIHAHIGPAYSCAWHLELDNRVLSAGRDKTIKVFDVQGARAKELYLINAMSSIARGKWRPQHKNHVTSCSHLLDNVVAVWDIRRPFIQYATFGEHSDDVTDFLWLTEDVLISCAKDNRLIQRHFSTADHPTERATPVSVSLRPDGGLALSTSDSILQKNKTYSSSSSSRNPVQFRKQDGDSYEQSFLRHTSFLQEHVRTEEEWLYNFRKCAEEFLIEGQPTDKLCDHNYEVCRSVNKIDAAQTWLLLKLLFCGLDVHCSSFGLLPLSVQKSEEQEYNVLSRRISVKSQEDIDIGEINKNKKISIEDMNTDDDSHELMAGVQEFFEQQEEDSDSSTSGSVSHTQQNLELPKEPFQLRQDIVNREQSLERVEMESTSLSGIGSQTSGSQVQSQHTQPSSSHSHQSHLPGLATPTWDFPSNVAEMLKHYAEKGDVQMSVTIVLVFGDKVSSLIEERILVQWFYSYIEILTQFQMLSIAACITKICPIKQVKETSQQSTLFSVGCARCSKPLQSRNNSCQKCETTLNICSVCHTSVHGLFSWCEVCGHGGHYKHLRNWFTQHDWCPAGCGHTCTTSPIAIH